MIKYVVYDLRSNARCFSEGGPKLPCQLIKMIKYVVYDLPSNDRGFSEGGPKL